MSITYLMSHDHKACDELFAVAEASVGAGDWSAGAERFAAFHAAMERHFGAEEEVLFPAFEQARVVP